jgi:hypothetical protein
MSCALNKEADADQWRPVVDELAAAVELDETAG